MLLTVLSPFTWKGHNLKRGDVLEIPDGHPRLRMLLYGRHVAYCQRSGAKPGDNIFEGSGAKEAIVEELRVLPRGDAQVADLLQELKV